MLGSRRSPMMQHSLAFLTLALCLAVPGHAQTFSVVPGSTEPRIQLTGETFQIYSNALYFTEPVPGRSMSRYGVLGSDLGYPVVYPDKIVFLFGDTMGVSRSSKLLRSNRGRIGRRGVEVTPMAASGGGPFLVPPGGPDAPNDSIGYIPHTDLSTCHYIAQVEQQLRKGNAHPTVSTGSCPAIEFYGNPREDPSEHAFMATHISGLQSGEGLGPFRTPSGAFDYNGSLYMFYVVNIQEGHPHLALKSIVAKSDQPSSHWSSKHPPTFHRLYTVSEHSKVGDVSNPPGEEGGTGKFMFNPVVLMDAATLSDAGLTKGLPPALQNATKVAFVFGSSWKYNRSNVYLAAFCANDVEAGTSKWFYYAGQNGQTTAWSNDERAAAPLLAGAPNVGNHSVVWNAGLHRFILMYGNIVAQLSATPWGPWGEALVVLEPRSAWSTALIHHPGQDPIVRSTVPIRGPVSGEVLDISKDAEGVPYGPYLLDEYTSNPDGTVTVYFTMSTWNPYEVFLVSTTFKAAK